MKNCKTARNCDVQEGNRNDNTNNRKAIELVTTTAIEDDMKNDDKNNRKDTLTSWLYKRKEKLKIFAQQ